MGTRIVKANQATANKRRVYFDLRDATDGQTPETGEAGGQPQISTNGGAWTNTGIGTLNAIGNGRYYADLTQVAVATAGDVIETRFKSANTVETRGDTVQVVAYDPDDAAGLGLSRLDAAVSTRSSHTAADIWAVATRTLSNGAITNLTFAASAIDSSAIAGGAITSAKLGGSALTSAKFAAGAITSNAFAAGAIDANAVDSGVGSKILNTLTSALVTVGGLGKLIVDNLNAAITSRSAHTPADVRAEVDLNSEKLAQLISDATALTVRLTAIRAGYQIGRAHV